MKVVIVVGEALLLLLLITGCSGGNASIPPCNAIIWLFGAADLALDCPATNAIRLLERNPSK